MFAYATSQPTLRFCTRTSLRLSPRQKPSEKLRPPNKPQGGAEGKTDTSQKSKLTLWPSTMVDFLSRRLSRHFTIRAYTLDPSQLKSPIKSQAQMQPIPTSSQPIDGDPLKGLIRVHDIPAQRGFGEDSVKDDDDGASSGPPGSRLSDQLRSYYSKHLDPARRLAELRCASQTQQRVELTGKLRSAQS